MWIPWGWHCQYYIIFHRFVDFTLFDTGDRAIWIHTISTIFQADLLALLHVCHYRWHSICRLVINGASTYSGVHVTRSVFQHARLMEELACILWWVESWSLNLCLLQARYSLLLYLLLSCRLVSPGCENSSGAGVEAIWDGWVWCTHRLLADWLFAVPAFTIAPLLRS